MGLIPLAVRGAIRGRSVRPRGGRDKERTRSGRYHLSIAPPAPAARVALAALALPVEPLRRLAAGDCAVAGRLPRLAPPLCASRISFPDCVARGTLTREYTSAVDSSKAGHANTNQSDWPAGSGATCSPRPVHQLARAAKKKSNVAAKFSSQLHQAGFAEAQAPEPIETLSTSPPHRKSRLRARRRSEFASLAES